MVLIRCQDAFDPHTSLADQARIIASAMGSDAGFVEDASFWKLREVSVTVQAPDTWARRTGASRLSLTLAGRNLATWTELHGVRSGDQLERHLELQHRRVPDAAARALLHRPHQRVVVNPMSTPRAHTPMPVIYLRSRLAGAVVAALALAACDPNKALDVQDIDVLNPGSVTTKEALPALRNGVVSSFQVAYSGAADLSNGGHEGQVNLSGLLADEFVNTETFPDRISLDSRNILPSSGAASGIFFDLSRARAVADFADGQYGTLDPGTSGHAEVLSIGGFTRVLFGENYCSGVPFSTLKDASIEYGQPETRDEILNGALAQFDSAASMAATQQDDQLRFLALVGRGRALLDLGRFAEAGSAVASVPTSFTYTIEGSGNSTRQNNGIWNYTFNVFAFGVSDAEGGNGLPFASADDPRVKVFDTGDVGFDGETPFLEQLKYNDKTSDVALASGTEARLIQAEAALQAGDASGMLSILNTLRAGIGMPTLTDPGSQAGRVTLLFTERAYWLYLTSHRLGDLRRLVRQYGRGVETVFPTGEYFKGGTYGTDVNFPVPQAEKNNPNFSACIDRNP